MYLQGAQGWVSLLLLRLFILIQKKNEVVKGFITFVVQISLDLKSIPITFALLACTLCLYIYSSVQRLFTNTTEPSWVGRFRQSAQTVYHKWAIPGSWSQRPILGYKLGWTGADGRSVKCGLGSSGLTEILGCSELVWDKSWGHWPPSWKFFLHLWARGVPEAAAEPCRVVTGNTTTRWKVVPCFVNMCLHYSSEVQHADKICSSWCLKPNKRGENKVSLGKWFLVLSTYFTPLHGILVWD